MAEEKQAKAKPSFKNFVKSLFGDKFKGLSEEDTQRVLSELSSLEQDLLAEVNALAVTDPNAADKLAAQIAKTSGITFESFETGNGGKGFVLVDTTGKRRGGAFPTRENAQAGRIDDKTSVQGDAFISRNDVVKTIKGLGRLAGIDNLTEGLTSVIHQKSQTLQDVVAVETTKFEVKLPKALTTTAVAFLLGATLLGAAVGLAPKAPTPTPQPDTQIVYVDRYVEVEKEDVVTITELAERLMEDADDLVDEYGDTAQLIKAYKQEEWQEYKLAGKPTETQQGRQDLEATLESRLQTQDSFAQRMEAIEKGRADGTLSDRDYALEVLKLNRDIHQATAQIKGDEIVALDGVIGGLQVHLDYYNSQGWADDTHGTQITRYTNTKEASEGTIETSTGLAAQYDYVIAQMEANPDMTPEAAATLLQETMKNGVPQTTQTAAAESGTSADAGAVQE
ncbi:MAG: hypothetical protein IJW32_02175 [Clostridia bacterium]|nr:hypothetical protein [Clostridia bacterium]